MFFAGKILVSIGLLAGLLMLVDWASAWAAIAAIPASALFLAFAAATLGTIILPAMISWQALRISDIRLTLCDMVTINFAMRFYVIILPRIVTVWMRWRRYGRGALAAPAMALLLFERVLQFATLAGFAFVSLWLESGRLAFAGTQLLILTGAMSLLAVAAMAAFFWPALAQAIDRLVRAFGRWLPAFLAKASASLMRAIADFQRLERAAILSITLLSAVSFLFFVISSWILAQAMGLPLSFLALVWIRSLVFLITLMPIAIAGIGLRELGFVGALALYGIAMEQALAFSLANFALQLGMAAIGGLLEAQRHFWPSPQSPLANHKVPNQKESLS